MGKFVCSVDVKYLPSWSTAEGIREMLQNAKDAETQFDAKMIVRYRKDTQTLVIENKGTILPLKALLIGFSTKQDDRRLAGKYGEGLVFGILALVRAGHAVKIRTGGEVWIPRIERHDQVDENVLVFGIAKRKEENHVQIEIDHVTEAMWYELPRKFLFLNDAANDVSPDRVKTSYGTLLLDAAMRGDVFVKGIWVCHDQALNAGYDFADCETDRDRKMIESYDLLAATRTVWASALRTRPDLVNRFLSILYESQKDADGIYPWAVYSFEDEIKKTIAADFRTRFGEEAVPVGTLAESIEIEHLDRKGIIVSKPMQAMLEAVFGSTEELKKKLAKSAQKLYAASELTAEERANLDRAIARVQDALSIDAPMGLTVDVTDFRDENQRGLFHDGRVFLAKAILTDRSMTLRVLVHEAAHAMGGDDGERNHVANMEKLWAAIVEQIDATV